MSRKRYSTEQIIQKLREAEVELAKGRSVGEVAKQLGITDQTYYRWRREYGGLKTDQATRLKALERENTGLKRVVADLTLDKAAETRFSYPSSCSVRPIAPHRVRQDAPTSRPACPR